MMGFPSFSLEAQVSFELTAVEARAFDRDADSFETSGMLSFSKPVSESSRAGFQTDIIFGRTARILNSATTSGDGTTAEADDNFYVNQAYAEYLAPIGNASVITILRLI